jgi:hypothetical protein
MSAIPVTDVHKVAIGTLAHPGFAWVAIEQSKGVFDFQIVDNYVAGAQKLGLVDAATNTANMSIALSQYRDLAGNTVAIGGTLRLLSIVQIMNPAGLEILSMAD